MKVTKMKLKGRTYLKLKMEAINILLALTADVVTAISTRIIKDWQTIFPLSRDE